MQNRQSDFHGASLVLVTIVLAMGNFMEVLDTTIANVSLPSIAGDLGVSSDQGVWVITSYAVANAIAVLLSGWLAQRFGQVRVFVAAVAVFTLASALCGVSADFQMLIAARLLQGGVAGLMVPLSQALLMSSYPEEKRGMAMAFWGMTVVIAPVVGPILGGWITDNAGWPWIFYINVPVGTAVTFGAWQLLKRHETPRRTLPIDYVGLALIIVWVGALQVVLDKGNELDWFHSGFIVALSLVAAIGFIFFLIWELTDAHPIVDLRLLKIRNFRIGTLALSLGFGAFFGSIVLLPLWLQTQMAYTATWAGMVLAPSGILAFLLSPAVGKNLERIDPRIFVTLAFLTFAGSSFLRTDYTTTADYATIAIPQWLFGVGIAAFFAPLITIAMGGVSNEQTAFATGLMNFARLIGGSFGVALANTAWERRTALHHSQLVEHIANDSASATGTIAQLQQLGMQGHGALAQIDLMASREASTLAANDVYWLCGWLFLALIGFVWLARRPFGNAQAAA